MNLDESRHQHQPSTDFDLIPFPSLLIDGEFSVLSCNRAFNIAFDSGRSNGSEASFAGQLMQNPEFLKPLKESVEKRLVEASDLQFVVDIHLDQSSARSHLKLLTTVGFPNAAQAVLEPSEAKFLLILQEISPALSKKFCCLEQDGIQQEKLEAVGRLGAGIAHELNSPIQGLNDNLAFLMDATVDLFQLYGALRSGVDSENTEQQKLMEFFEAQAEKIDFDFLSEEIPDAISQSLEGVQQMRDVIASLREFSEPGSRDIVKDDIHEAIISTIRVTENRWRDLAKIETQFDQKIPCIPVDMAAIKQVILNLFTNALDAIADRKLQSKGSEFNGYILVRTQKLSDAVRIEVADNGIGIPKEIQNRIYEPFFTTKEVGDGIGQGMSTVYDIVVRKHKGDLSFASVVNQGTRFFITFPVQNDREEPQQRQCC